MPQTAHQASASPTARSHSSQATTYLRFKLSFRELVEKMEERGLSVAHTTTIMRWVPHYSPEFERRWNRFAQPAGASWRVDET